LANVGFFGIGYFGFGALGYWFGRQFFSSFIPHYVRRACALFFCLEKDFWDFLLQGEEEEL